MTHSQAPISKVPEPALVRGTLIAITGIISLVVGHQIDVTWIEIVTNVYAALSPVIAAILIRQKVTPVEVAEARVEQARREGPTSNGGAASAAGY